MYNKFIIYYNLLYYNFIKIYSSPTFIKVFKHESGVTEILYF